MKNSGPRVTKGHCPECGPDRNATVVGEHIEKYNEDIWVSTDYLILKCRGCNYVYFQTQEVSSEGEMIEELIDGRYEQVIKPVIKQYPRPVIRRRPDWSEDLWHVDTQLRILFADLYTALDNHLNVFVAIGIRTTFDRASELLGIDPAKTFRQKLDELTSNGIIGKGEHDILDTLTNAGNAAAHRGWRPGAGELQTLLAALENFMERAFILGSAAKELRASVPARPQRGKPA